jgi:hypothetical protein
MCCGNKACVSVRSPKTFTLVLLFEKKAKLRFAFIFVCFKWYLLSSLSFRCMFASDAMLCCALLRYVMLCYATLRYATLRYAVLCYAMLCYAMICYAML